VTISFRIELVRDLNNIDGNLIQAKQDMHTSFLCNAYVHQVEGCYQTIQSKFIYREESGVYNRLNRKTKTSIHSRMIRSKFGVSKCLMECCYNTKS